MTEQEMYNNFCKDRFDGHDKRLDSAVGAINALTVKIDNGLTNRVKRIDKLIWLIAVVVIGKVIVDIFI